MAEFEQLCEVQSDKASVEITSQYEGTVMRLLHREGDIVQVGEPLPQPRHQFVLIACWQTICTEQHCLLAICCYLSSTDATVVHIPRSGMLCLSWIAMLLEMTQQSCLPMR